MRSSQSLQRTGKRRSKEFGISKARKREFRTRSDPQNGQFMEIVTPRRWDTCYIFSK